MPPPPTPDAPTLAKAVSQQLTGADPPKILVDSVEFDNAANIPRQAQQLMLAEVREHPLYDTAGSVNELNETGIRGVLQNNGYFRAESSIHVDVVSTASIVEHINLMIHAETGPQYHLGTVVFRSASAEEPLAFSDAQLMQFLHMRQGDIFDTDKLRQTFDGLKNLYGRHGYIDFMPTPDFEINDEARIINLDLVLDQEQMFRVRHLEFIGDNPAVEQAIRAKIAPGMPVDARALREFNGWILSATKNPKEGSADLQFDFMPCPNQ